MSVAALTKNPASTSMQWRNNGVGRVGKVQGAPSVRGPRVPSKKIITVKCRHNYSHHNMFRCSIAAANTDKLQFKFKFYSYFMWNCVDDKIDNTHYGRQSVGCIMHVHERKSFDG